MVNITFHTDKDNIYFIIYNYVQEINPTDFGQKILAIIFIIVLGILLEILCNAMLFGIFLYEKYGVDSQRRTIINMLLSQVCFATIVLNLLSMPFWVYGHFVSRIAPILAVLTGFVFNSGRFKSTSYSTTYFKNKSESQPELEYLIVSSSTLMTLFDASVDTE